LEIEVKNPEGVCRGVKTLTLNGETVAGSIVPAESLKELNDIEVVLGG